MSRSEGVWGRFDDFGETTRGSCGILRRIHEVLSIQTLKNYLETTFLDLQVDPEVSGSPYIRTTLPRKWKITKIHWLCYVPHVWGSEGDLG